MTLPQTEFLSDRGLTINDIDEVMIQERLSDDFKVFKEKYGLDVELRCDNRGDNDTTNILNGLISSHIDIQKRIVRLYKKDFKLYNKLINE